VKNSKQATPQAAPDRIIRKPELEELTGLSSETIRRMEAAGDWPKRVQLGPKAVGWWLSECMAALQQRRKQ